MKAIGFRFAFPWVAAALFSAAFGATAGAQSVYRWVDANGRVQYSDQAPPADAKNVQQRSVGGNSIQNNDLSLVTQDAQKKNPVTLYVSECGDACDAAKGYLNKRGIPHTLVDPTRTIELNKKFRDETGGAVVPVLKVGERRLSGWSEESWASALDAAGYPKTPSFARPKPLEDRSGLDKPPQKAPGADADSAKAAVPPKG